MVIHRFWGITRVTIPETSTLQSMRGRSSMSEEKGGAGVYWEEEFSLNAPPLHKNRGVMFIRFLLKKSSEQILCQKFQEQFL